MRITCPICGERDRREFYYKGASLERPAPEAGDEAWEAYVHLRENPAGETRELWYHETGCSAWIEVRRDTVSHEMIGSRLVSGAGA